MRAQVIIHSIFGHSIFWLDTNSGSFQLFLSLNFNKTGSSYTVSA